MNASNLFRLQSDLATLLLDAQTVMNLRVMGMSGVIPAEQDENTRMIEEKPTAWIDAWAAGTHAMIDGRSAVDVLSAGMAPLTSKVRENRDRLMK